MIRRLPASIVGFVAAAGLASPASAAMNVQTFLDKVAGLKAQGMGALLSPDFSLVRTEAQSAVAELKAERDARKAAGKPPIACVPDGEHVGVDQMLDGLAKLSPAERRLPLKDGYARVLQRAYPCR